MFRFRHVGRHAHAPHIGAKEIVMSDKMRTETDTMGEVEVPADRYWGAQTGRSLINFPIGTETMPLPLIRALGIVKKAAALANCDLGKLDGNAPMAIAEAAAR
jgi:fumarate hydratase class II